MRGPAVLATCAQEIRVSNNTEKKEVVSDKYHKLDFIFLMSDRQNAKDCPTVNEARCYGGDGLLTKFL